MTQTMLFFSLCVLAAVVVQTAVLTMMVRDRLYDGTRYVWGEWRKPKVKRIVRWLLWIFTILPFVNFIAAGACIIVFVLQIFDNVIDEGGSTSIFGSRHIAEWVLKHCAKFINYLKEER